MSRVQGFCLGLQLDARESERRADLDTWAVRSASEIAAVRQLEQKRVAEENARIASLDLTAAKRKQLQRENVTDYDTKMQEATERLNSALDSLYREVEGLLHDSLLFDAAVDLTRFHRVVSHPPLDETKLQPRAQLSNPIREPMKPKLREIRRRGLFGREQRFAKEQIMAEAELAEALDQWAKDVESVIAMRVAARQKEDLDERIRGDANEAVRANYLKECAARVETVSRYNAPVDDLIEELELGLPEAVVENVQISLACSVYPTDFRVEHVVYIDAVTMELSVRVLVPAPADIPTIKAYRYAKSAREINAVALSQKDMKDRYSRLIQQIALRTLKEVYEADQQRSITAVSLEVATVTINPATGNRIDVLFVAVRAPRTEFAAIDLSAVVPGATLGHFGASLSRNPFGLVSIGES